MTRIPVQITLSPMPAARNDVDWSAIAVQAAAGATHQEIADHYGLPLGTVKARCTREGWKATARAIVAQKTETEEVKTGNATLRPNASRTSLELLSKLGERSKYRAAKVGDNTLRAISRRKEDRLIASAPAYLATVNALAKVHGWGSERGSTVNLAVQVNANQVPEA